VITKTQSIQAGSPQRFTAQFSGVSRPELFGGNAMKTQAQQNYAAKRFDPRWQKKRLEIMQRDEFKCTECNDEKSTLNVHHRYYVKNREVWDYPAFSLVTLCEGCHSTAHPKLADDEESAMSEWEAGIGILAEGKDWPADFWRLGELLAIDFGVNLKGLISFLEKQIADHKANKAEALP
jgi:hypothetical protein